MAEPLPGPVVVLAGIEWSFTWQRHQIFATELARHSPRVLFVDSLPKRFPSLAEAGRALRRLSQRNRPVKGRVGHPRPDNLTLLSPLALPAVGSLWHRLNRRIFLPRLVAQITRITGPSPFVLNYLPTQSAVDLCRLLRPRRLVYDYVEHWAGDPRTPAAVLAAHRAMLRLADLVVSPSPFLAEEAEAVTGQPARLLPHGVDFAYFNQLDPGRVVGQVKRVGYFGGIGPYLDYAWLERVGREFEILLLGPQRVPLPAMPGVVWHPPVPHSQVVAEIASCDAFLLAYKVGNYARGLSPVKLMECFATGRPIVATPIPALEPYASLVALAPTGEEAAARLADVPAWESEEKRQARMALARRRSWAQAAEEMVGVLRGGGDDGR